MLYRFRRLGSGNNPSLRFDVFPGKYLATHIGELQCFVT